MSKQWCYCISCCSQRLRQFLTPSQQLGLSAAGRPNESGMTNPFGTKVVHLGQSRIGEKRD